LRTGLASKNIVLSCAERMAILAPHVANRFIARLSVLAS
jgi:hypothetical protein